MGSDVEGMRQASAILSMNYEITINFLTLAVGIAAVAVQYFGLKHPKAATSKPATPKPATTKRRRRKKRRRSARRRADAVSIPFRVGLFDTLPQLAVTAAGWPGAGG